MGACDAAKVRRRRRGDSRGSRPAGQGLLVLAFGSTATEFGAEFKVTSY